MTSVDPDLAALLQRVGPHAGDPGPMPEVSGVAAAEPSAAAHIAALRARHDAVAIALLGQVAQTMRAELGPDPLGCADVPLEITWDAVPVPGGEVGLRRYRPQQSPDAPLPVIAFIHGGGFWMGGGATAWEVNDALCRALSARVGAVVVSIDHRLAPEHPFPVPLDDVTAAVEHIVATAPELGGDPERLGLYGISSGGNLAAALAARAGDGAAPPVRAVALEVPSVNLSLDSNRFTASAAEVAGAERIVSMYTAGHDPADPEISPGLRADLSALAPTLVITAELDPLTADALTYVERLREAGVPVTSRTAHMTHAVAVPAVRRELVDLAVTWLRETLA